MKLGSTLSTCNHRYTLTQHIGDGGSGVVYAGSDEQGNKWAIKVLNMKAPGFTTKLERFRNELEFCRRNTHPNILTVCDANTDTPDWDVRPFYVMRRYRRSLDHLIKEGIPVDRVLVYFRQLLEALEHVHTKGIIHRDIKPKNVLFDDERDALLLADFGIAHFTEEDLRTTVNTGTGERLANIEYAAPEQRRPGGCVDQRADIYALGLVLHEMFTRIVPQGQGYGTIASRSLRHGGLDALVTAMIQHDPNARLASISVVRERLRTLQLVPRPTGLKRISTANNPLPAFAWDEVPGAETYAVRVDSSEWMEVGGQRTYTHSKPLDPGVHRFEVRGLDADANPSDAAVVAATVKSDASLANTRILLRTATGLVTVRHDGTDMRVLVTDPHARKPAWSPDGSLVAYCTSDGSHKLKLASRSEGETRTLLDAGKSVAPQQPRWAPDAAAIYYVQDTALWRIGTASPDSSPELVGEALGGEFDLSPDGTRAVWAAWGGSIVICRLDGSDRSELVAPGSDTFVSKPRWSPEGGRILYCSAIGHCSSTGAPGADLFIVSAVGGEPTRMTSNSRQDSSPSWAPDGTLIAFYANRAVGSGLYVMDLEDRSTVAKVYGYSEQKIEASISALMADVEWSPFLPPV
jgi:serine/threonine protein kinase